MQTNKLTTKPVAEVVSAINALDLESVKIRLMDSELGKGWTRAYADRIEAAYRNFLTMVVKHQEHAEDIMLAKDVDEFWHTHILQTIKYAEDCQRVFGTFLHHAPHVGERTAADLEKREIQADKTRALYEREFGPGVDAAWSGGIAAQSAAFSGAAVEARDAGFSGVALQARKAAFSGVALKTDNAAFSGAALKAKNAAFSGAALKAENAAFSGAALKAENAAFSGAALKAENAAFSGAAIEAQNAAFSGVALRAHDSEPSAVSG
jgi:hypothetical protein